MTLKPSSQTDTSGQTDNARNPTECGAGTGVTFTQDACPFSFQEYCQDKGSKIHPF